MGVLIFLVFPELSARTEYGCDMAGNPGRQNGTKTRGWRQRRSENILLI